MMYIALLLIPIVQLVYSQENSGEMQSLVQPAQRSSSTAQFYYGGKTSVRHTTSLDFSLHNQEFKLSSTVLGCIPWTLGRGSGFLSIDTLHSVALTPHYGTILLGLRRGTIIHLQRVSTASVCAAAQYRIHTQTTYAGNKPCVAMSSSGSTWAAAHTGENSRSTIRVWDGKQSPKKCEVDDEIAVLLTSNKTAVAGSSTCIYTASLGSSTLSFSPLELRFAPGDHELRLGIQEDHSDTLLISNGQGTLLQRISLENDSPQG